MRERLSDLIRRLEMASVLVIGDFMLDEFLFGEITRVSREAPVLILRYQETILHAGGAANTVANVAELGASVIAAGFVGADEAAEQMVQLWPEQVDASAVLRDSAFRTTRKTRILAGSFHSFRQQVVRLDHEHRLTLDPAREEQLLAVIRNALPGADSIVISDYSLGNLTPRVRGSVIELARRSRIPLIVDSRDDPAGYPGATSVTPNITEVEAVLRRTLGRDTRDQEPACSQLLKEWQVDTLLVTRGRHGMSLYEPGQVFHLPAYGSDEVVDVTGAGDTVAATFATALAAGGSFEEAARLSNMAGGIAVMKRGTATVSPEELQVAVAKASS